MLVCQRVIAERCRENIGGRHGVLDREIDADAVELTKNAADPELATLAESVVTETPVEQELTVAACRDPYDGPVGEGGSLCHASPSMCLQCRNAVIFRDHLPRLVAYSTVLRNIEKSMAPIPFAETYGQQYVNIDAVLARFPDEQVEAARSLQHHVHRPFGQRAEL